LRQRRTVKVIEIVYGTLAGGTLGLLRGDEIAQSGPAVINRLRGRREACCFRACRGSCSGIRPFQNGHTRSCAHGLFPFDNFHDDPDLKVLAGVDDDVEDRRFAGLIFRLTSDFKSTPAEGRGNQKMGEESSARFAKV